MNIGAVNNNLAFRGRRYHHHSRSEEGVVETIKEKYDDVKVGTNEVVAATVGTGTAGTLVTLNKSGKVWTFLKGATKGSKVLPETFAVTKKSCLSFVEKLGPLAKLAKSKAVAPFVGFFAGLTGVAAVITNGYNIVGTTAKLAEKNHILD